MKVLLEKAISIAVNAHKGQVDKGGNPYILHPLSVMMNVHTIEEKIVAVLHDLIEDTDWTFDRLRSEGFPEDIISGIDGVTRRENESRKDFIKRASENPLSKSVKREDLKQNLDLTRIPCPTEEDFRRIKMYEKELIILKA